MNTLRKQVRAIKQVKKAFSTIHALSHAIRFKMRTYRPNVTIEVSAGRYTVKTITGGEELEKVLRLRHDVFLQEMQNRHAAFGLDLDKYDFLFDHLAVIENKTGDVIGTYRLNSTKFNSHFYSEKEFHMSSISALKGNKLELGRACIRPDKRSGATIAALWKGLGAYIVATDTRYLLGCSSISITDAYTCALVHHYMNENHLSDESLRVYPRMKFRMKKLDKFIDKTSAERFAPFREAAINMVPALLHSYLKAGSVVCGQPAYDKAFQCIDYFTLLDIEQIDEGFRRKFI